MLIMQERGHIQDKLERFSNDWCESDCFTDLKDEFKSKATERCFQRMPDDL